MTRSSTTPNWSKYPRCPRCFREWDCRRVRRGQRYTRHIVAVLDQNHDVIKYQTIRLAGSYGGWHDAPLKRPHKGRRQRDKAVPAPVAADTGARIQCP